MQNQDVKEIPAKAEKTMSVEEPTLRAERTLERNAYGSSVDQTRNNISAGDDDTEGLRRYEFCQIF